MNIRLSNRTRRMVHYEIPSTCGVPSAEPQKVARVTRTIDPLGGPIAVDMTVSQRSFPMTITLCARGTSGCVSDELPESVLKAPSIQNALRAQPQEIEVQRIHAPTKIDVATEQDAAPTETTSPEEN